MKIEDLEYPDGGRFVEISGNQMYRSSGHDGKLQSTHIIPKQRLDDRGTYNQNNGFITAIDAEGRTFVGFGLDTRAIPLEGSGYTRNSGLSVECLQGGCPDPLNTETFNAFNREYKRVAEGRTYSEVWGPASFRKEDEVQR